MGAHYAILTAIVVSFTVTLGTFARADYPNEPANIEYEGEESVRVICLSIANDEVLQLRRSLKYKRVALSDTNVHYRFTCNGLDLLDFSRTMASSNVTAYLSQLFDEQTTAPMTIVSHNPQRKIHPCSSY